MIKKSLRLRLRLILAFSAMVSLILCVGLVSHAIHDRVRTDVQDLRSGDVFDLTKIDLKQVGLDIRGYWNPNGSFVADDIEVELPRSPRLRGEIQEVDPERRTVTLYGVPVQIVDKTRNGDDEAQPFRFESLQPGQRIEVTCEVKDGVWRARKIYARDIKSSDKVKGVVTKSHLDGVVPETIEIHGLEIVVEPIKGGNAESALARIEQATQMILTLQECRAHAHDLVGEAAAADSGKVPLKSAAGRALANAASRFQHIVEQAYREGEDSRSVPLGSFRRYLDRLTQKQRQLDERVSRITKLAATDLNATMRHLDLEFSPFLEKEIMPTIYAYLSLAEEELGDQLRGVLDRTRTTARVALGASVVALGVAILLGWLVWRSIQRPIRHLHDAAIRLGQGHLDTRVEIGSRDEFGVLAEAFNRMASDLASTTVSMASLESVFDSMAAALIVLDSGGRIVNVNRATCDMLGRDREELMGGAFDTVCRFGPDEHVGPLVSRKERDGDIASIERVFVRKDGSEFPVSLSGAELSSAGGPVQGYVCVAQDLTEHKRVEATIREALAEKELLVQEIHHRVKNNMQVISSLLAMQASDGDSTVEKRLQESQNRIRTITLIHEQLYQSSELAHIDIRSYLEVLTTHLIQSFGVADSVKLLFEVDNVDLDIDQSLAVGLIVNELMTNSLKHAFPGGRRGSIRIGLAADEDGTRTLLVADDGCGMTESAEGEGPLTLGTSLIATLARQLRGRVEVNGDGGTTTRIVFGKSANQEAVS